MAATEGSEEVRRKSKKLKAKTKTEEPSRKRKKEEQSLPGHRVPALTEGQCKNDQTNGGLDQEAPKKRKRKQQKVTANPAEALNKIESPDLAPEETGRQKLKRKKLKVKQVLSDKAAQPPGVDPPQMQQSEIAKAISKPKKTAKVASMEGSGPAEALPAAEAVAEGPAKKKKKPSKKLKAEEQLPAQALEQPVKEELQGTPGQLKVNKEKSGKKAKRKASQETATGLDQSAEDAPKRKKAKKDKAAEPSSTGGKPESGQEPTPEAVVTEADAIQQAADEGEAAAAQETKLTSQPSPAATRKGTAAAAAFQRVKAEEWVGKKGAWDNSYRASFGESGWGAKAQAVLGQVRGRDFRHEKTKKKRGSYRGGVIDNAVNSIKFDSDAE